MGAGVAKFPPEDHSEQSSMSVCENCSTRFTPFKRKKPCHECGRNFCSSCAEKIPENTSHRRCGRCSRLVNGNFSRKDLESYKARELHQFLTKRKVPVQNCREKNDLIDVVMKFSNNDHYRAEQREHQAHLQSLQRLRENLASPEGADTSGGTNPDHSREIPRPPDYTTLYHPATTTTTTQNTEGTSQHSTQSPSTEQQSHDQQSADPSHAMSVPSQPETSEPPGDNDAQSAGNTGSQPTEGAEQSPKADQRPSFMKLCDVKTLESIKDLTTRQLKEILSGNFVDYKGCVEKAELIQRVERLYIENENNKKTASQIEESAHTGEVELCKICMDRLVDCVLLECGHMLTCTQCGRQLAECPICRQYVVRVVHVFKS